MEKKAPFKESSYINDKPMLEIMISSDIFRKKILALADTGCDCAMLFCRKIVEKEGLILGQKINKEPVPIAVADGLPFS